MSDFKIEWIDRGREPQCEPNPNFPEGVDADCRLSPIERGCSAELPYPAPRCGYFYVECRRCGTNALITTAGRPDDPRTVTLACKEKPN